jgi:hypothetical protein
MFSFQSTATRSGTKKENLYELDMVCLIANNSPCVNVYPSFSLSLDSVKHNLKTMEDTYSNYIYYKRGCKRVLTFADKYK